MSRRPRKVLRKRRERRTRRWLGRKRMMKPNDNYTTFMQLVNVQALVCTSTDLTLRRNTIGYCMCKCDALCGLSQSPATRTNISSRTSPQNLPQPARMLSTTNHKVGNNCKRLFNRYPIRNMLKGVSNYQPKAKT